MREAGLAALPEAAVTAPAVEVAGLRKVYRSRRRGPVVAVDGLSFEVARGEIVGLLGPNGAGKTTTIKCICGLVRPEEGRVAVEGLDAIRRPREALARLAAVLEGNRNIYWRLTTRENLELFAGLHGIAAARIRPQIARLIEVFGLGEKRDAEARTLSRGMQQKLAVACALIKETPVLLLDEPTLGLDVETSYELRGLLRRIAAEEGRTILLSSHDMDVVQSMCERVIIINEGRIVTDDLVSNLLGLFKVRAYRFTIAGRPHPGLEGALRAMFPLVAIETADTHQSTIEVELLDGAQIYDLMDLLRRHGGVIESIDRLDPDLEEVFLKIVKGEARR